MTRPDPLASSTFSQRAHEQLGKPFLRQAVPKATDHAYQALRERFRDHDYDALREQGRRIRADAVEHLDAHLTTLVEALSATA